MGMMFNWFKTKRHATQYQRASDHTLYGRSKLEWFWMRHAEKDDYLRRLSLREYAKLKSLQ
jgi:hypothetical protein